MMEGAKIGRYEIRRKIGTGWAKCIWLKYEKREFNLVFFKVDPRLDPLRDDLRFQGLLRKVGFSQQISIVFLMFSQ
jgi:hypothetical protein